MTDQQERENPEQIQELGRRLLDSWRRQDPDSEEKLRALEREIQAEFPTADPVREADWIRRRAERRMIQILAERKAFGE